MARPFAQLLKTFVLLGLRASLPHVFKNSIDQLEFNPVDMIFSVRSDRKTEVDMLIQLVQISIQLVILLDLIRSQLPMPTMMITAMTARKIPMHYLALVIELWNFGRLRINISLVL